MDENKKNWIEGVMGSLSGSRRAKPGSDLFSKIETKLLQKETSLVSRNQWRVVAAAAVLLLFLNTIALTQYSKLIPLNSEEWNAYGVEKTSIISDYKLYEL